MNCNIRAGTQYWKHLLISIFSVICRVGTSYCNRITCEQLVTQCGNFRKANRKFGVLGFNAFSMRSVRFYVLRFMFKKNQNVNINSPMMDYSAGFPTIVIVVN